MLDSVSQDTISKLFAIQPARHEDVEAAVRPEAPVIFMNRGEEATREQKSSKIGRNDPCPCGSGKKYKKCCGK